MENLYTVTDLANDFYSVPLQVEDQDKFAFTQNSLQYTFTVLLQCAIIKWGLIVNKHKPPLTF